MTNLIVGLVCLALGAWGVTAWWDEFGEVLRGLLPAVFILAGLAAVGAGMKSKRTTVPQGEEDDFAVSSADSPADRCRKAG